MKLLSCYIENFGKISQKEFVFDERITLFLEENGHGKTTLAEFIKSMFYGLLSYKTTTKDFVSRKHYYPFNGGLFGGNIVFIYENKKFKIERFFDQTSETRDSMTVYVDGVKCEDYPYDIGRVLFGIDKESFERTSFVTADEIEVKSTSSINLKLNAFLQGGTLDFDFDKTIQILENKAKDYKKSRQGSDKITEKIREINELDEKISNITTISNNLEVQKQRLDSLSLECKEVSNKISSENTIKQQLSEWERYEDMLTSITTSKEALNDIKSRYKNGVPSYLEVNEVQQALNSEKQLQAKIEGLDFTYNEKLSLAKLSDTFKNGVLKAEEATEVQNLINEYQSLNSKIEMAGNTELSSRQKEVVSKLSINPPSEAEVENQKQLIEKHRNLTKELEVSQRVVKSQAPVKPNFAYIIMLIASIVALFVSVALAFDFGAIGYVCSGVAGLLFIVSVILLINSKNQAQQGNFIDNPNYLLLQKELVFVEDSIKSFLIQRGYISPNGILYDFATFLNDYNLYNEYLVSSSALKQNVKSLIDSKESVEKTLNSFFSKYNIYGDNYILNLSSLQSSFSTYQALIAKKQEIESLSEKLSEQSTKNKLIINSFKQKYSLLEIEPTNILVDVKTCDIESKNIEELTLKADEFKKEKNLTIKPEVSSDYNELLERYEFLQNEISKLKLEISSSEFVVETLDGYLIDRDKANEELEKFKDTHRLLLLSVKYLTKAEQNLKDKYVKPIKDEFMAFADIIEKVLNEKITMTKDFEIRFERNGVERSDKHLSSGLKSILAFCFRLALIKNMYRETLPFLILDDPFVSLDEKHFNKIKEVINLLSKDMQIIYFTCHNSRKI